MVPFVEIAQVPPGVPWVPLWYPAVDQFRFAGDPPTTWWPTANGTPAGFPAVVVVLVSLSSLFELHSWYPVLPSAATAGVAIKALMAHTATAVTAVVSKWRLIVFLVEFTRASPLMLRAGVPVRPT
jgi:hypothetical protein